MCPLIVFALLWVFFWHPLTEKQGKWYVPLSSLFLNMMSMLVMRWKNKLERLS
jgi:hypothetical protein